MTTPDLMLALERSLCTCPDDGVICLGEGYPDDPGTCRFCMSLEGERHCPKCPCDDCEEAP